MTDSQRVADLLQEKFNRGYALSGDEDFMLELCREHALQQQVKKERDRTVTTTNSKLAARVQKLVEREFAKQTGKFAKSMHLSDEAEQHLRNLRDTVRAANSHLDKIDFQDRAPEGDLEPRGPADAVMPAKSAKSSGVNVNALGGRDVAAIIGSQAVLAKAVRMDPAHAEVENQTLPGRSVDARDASGDLSKPQSDELENLARAGSATAIAALMGHAMKRTVLAVRG
jgi:hypothetical protein